MSPQYPSVQKIMPTVKSVWAKNSDLIDPLKLRLLGGGSAVATPHGRGPVWYTIDIVCDHESPNVRQLMQTIEELENKIEAEVQSPIALTLLSSIDSRSSDHAA